MNNTLRWTAAVLAMSASWAAIAQSASAPAKVAVSASDAAAADRKAVPKAEVGTVVRTGPSATDKAKSMAPDKDTPDTRMKKAAPAPRGASHVAPAKAD
jgi:hypothetical protein